MVLSSCAFQTSKVQHEQPDDVYWNSSDNQDKVKTLDDVKFEQNPPASPKQPKPIQQPRQPKQLQESSVQDEAVGVEPNDEARAEAAYQAWNQQRLANKQTNGGSSDAKAVQEIQSLAPSNANQTPQAYNINNYNNYYYNNNGLRRNGLRYRSRWYNSPSSYNMYGGSYLGWNNFSGWQFGYQWPHYYTGWISPYCFQPVGPICGYNPYFNNYYGHHNPYFSNYYGYGYGYGNPWGGYYWPWHSSSEKNNNPSKSRPREMVGGAGKDHSDQNGGMISPGSKPFLGKKENDATNGSGTGKVNQPGLSIPSQQVVPTVSTPIQAKPYEQPGLPIQQPVDNTHAIPAISQPVSASPNHYSDKSFRIDETNPGGGKLIRGDNGPVYVPPRDHASQSMPEPTAQPGNFQGIRTPSVQPNRGYVPERNQSVQSIQSPAPRNEFPSRTQERIEYQAPAPQKSSGGFGGFSNGSGSGSSSGNSGNRSNAPISRPR